MNKAIFFDRDDTLIRDVPYNDDPDLVELMPGARQACHALNSAGYLLFIISNQSGVGRGYISVAQVKAVNDRLLDLLGGDIITDIYCCYDTPDDPPDCRKPMPTMLLKASMDYDIDLIVSFMVGDKLSDVQAGDRAGCQTIHMHAALDNPHGQACHIADYCANDMAAVAAFILS